MRIYSALGEKAQAYYEQALPLFRQVGDRWGEAVTRYNIAVVAADLGDLARSETELEAVVTIDEAVGRPNLERHRATLDQIRAMRR